MNNCYKKIFCKKLNKIVVRTRKYSFIHTDNKKNINKIEKVAMLKKVLSTLHIILFMSVFRNF